MRTVHDGRRFRLEGERGAVDAAQLVVAANGFTPALGWLRDRVFPLMFFLGIQPNTDLEQRLLQEGYLSAGYNPLMLTPTSIRKLLYNPAPLNKFIAKACLRAWERKQGSRDPRRWTGSLSQRSQTDDSYADQSLSRGIEGNSGRDALLSLEEILRSRRPHPSSAQAPESHATSAG